MSKFHPIPLRDMVWYIVYDLQTTQPDDLEKTLYILEEVDLEKDQESKKPRFLKLSAPFTSLGDVHDVLRGLNIGGLSTFFRDSDHAEHLCRELIKERREWERQRKIWEDQDWEDRQRWEKEKAFYQKQVKAQVMAELKAAQE